MSGHPVLVADGADIVGVCGEAEILHALSGSTSDYNGHLRDANYALIASYAADALMDYLGLNADYRHLTRCTLYSLEMHLHYRHEIMQTDQLDVATSILDFDTKRIHVGCQFNIARLSDNAATVEMMLLHVHQGETPKSTSLPAAVIAQLALLQLTPEAAQRFWPRSRLIQLGQRRLC